MLREGLLECSGGHEFPVRDGIPRFANDGYAGSFGFQWTRFARTQLDSASGATDSRDAFRLKTGFSEAALKGRRVLDLGCGMGRFAEIAADWGAQVVGVDLSAAVDAAGANLHGRQNVGVVQADVANLPFPAASFDFIYSIGVLHHTVDTHTSFHRLPPLLKPGGQIAVWVYSTKLRVLIGSQLLRPITSRLPKPLLLRMCRIAIPLGPLEMRRLVGRFLQVVLPVSLDPRSEWRWLDTFDWYSPRYQHKHSYGEVEGWFREAGLQDVRRLSFPTSVAGRRPSASSDR